MVAVPSPPHEIETLAEGPSALRRDAEPEPEPALVLGETFAGRYRIERYLGRGSMGTVYAAHDATVDERIALKVLRTSSEQAIERFRREVRLARKVTHRNAARTFDLGERGRTCFITMELVEGESLRRRLDRDARVPADDVLEIAQQVCMGLQAAHDVGVIHRDLKPANVLVEPQGRVVITDFGVARSTGPDLGPDLGPDPTAALELSTPATDPSQHTLDDAPMAGTPAYMAPEQVLGLVQDGRTDLYALGVMLYELLTGQTPWSGGNQIEVAVSRMLGPPPDPRAHVALPDGLAELVLACMAREPAQRPRSPTAVVERLRALRSRVLAVGSSRAADDHDTGSSQGSLFVPTALGERTLAVMPFRYHGPPDEAYLAEALADELIDLLAMTRGLRVSASGATQRYRDERDARTVGRALGVSSIIEGTVQRSAAEIRIVARLVDVETGFQRWSERFTGRLEDVFELQDRMAKRVAEALRVELTLQEHGAGASREAVEHYLRGRALARTNEVSGVELEVALEHFTRARAAAPGFVLPLAAIADATVRRWFVARQVEGEPWAEASRLAVQQALHGAPGLAETHLAAARLDVHRGSFRAAALHLDTALQIAPTCAAAHEYLGILQCDTGRSREGVRHILLAHELDPTLGMGGLAVLRHHALRGEYERFEDWLERLRQAGSVPRLVLDMFELRMALWRGQAERARAMRWPRDADGAALAVMEPMRMAIDEEVPVTALAAGLDEACARTANPRLRTTWRQVAAELLAWRGAHELALRSLLTAEADGMLLDADWLEGCPVLAGLCGDAAFEALRERVRERADEIWRAASERVW